MSDTNEYLTQEKHDELERELEIMKKDKRKEIAESLEYAKSLGDLSENAEYHEAREAQAKLEDRIQKVEQMLKSAKIVSSKHGTSAVDIGASVTLKRETDGKTFKYVLVGSEEADVMSGKISVHSPLGECIIGRKKGDTTLCETPNGPVNYKIISIN